MKIFKKFVYLLLAAVMCLGSMQLHADADDMWNHGAWYVGQYYVVDTSGVYGYTDWYIAGGEKEVVKSFNVGDVVYADMAINEMGINWANCYSDANHSSYYGCVDMAFLTPYDQYYAPEPETDPPTEPPTTKKKTTTTTTTTTKATTTTTTVLTTTTEETTAVTTTGTDENAAAVAAVNNNNNSNNSSSFVSRNFTALLIGAVVMLLAASAALAIILVYMKKSKASKNVKCCAKCGAANDINSVFCNKCGNSF